MSELRAPLEAAIVVAREAGGLLRAEFHRPGGPRGAPGKAPIDGEVEALLHARLAGAFPTFGFRGEEHPALNRAPREARQTSWLVDPNDGTSPFQRGHRGASVSIALLREGRPVLGVVYAYAAPDGEGDLLAWAEGCGALARNGRAIPPHAWPETLAEGHTVFVSNGADGCPEANARAVLPARFRRAPGVAYRLARVAGGDGVAATSLYRPRDFDYAAGHALLRGVGGVLVDERGREISYRPMEPTQLGFCFGGAPGVVQQLARHQWAPVMRAPFRQRGEPGDLTRTSVDALCVDVGRLRRAQGCWLGQLVGDALGSQVEFQTPETIAEAWPGGVRRMCGGGPFDLVAGQPTDDSELAIALARAMVEADGYDADVVASAYGRWLASRPFDIGQTTHQALGAARGSTPAASARAAASRDSQANGALMRVSAIGIAGSGWTEAAVVATARADAALTHPHPVCADANAVFALSIAFAIREGVGPAAVYAHAVERAEALGLHDDVRATLAAAAAGPPADFVRQMGWVRKALQNAFWQLLSAPHASEGVVDTVGRGGDTDTNGCIAGALLGAVYGRDAWPAAWRDRVLTCRTLPLPGVRHPRPVDAWPVDGLVLAERLLFV